MSQSLLTLRASKSAAEEIFATLEIEFEDDGYGIAITEIDEDADIHEVSLYVATDEALISATIARIKSRLAAENLSETIGREDLPDIDWVAKSLEGLKPVRAGRFLVHGAHDKDQVRSNDIGIEIEFVQDGPKHRHGYYQLLDWGDHNPEWIEQRIELIRKMVSA